MRLITKRDVSLLLNGLGWTYTDNYLQKFDFWKKNDIEIDFPSVESKADYHECLERSLRRLSQVEGIDLQVIYTNLENISYDIVRLRIANPSSSDGMLDIDSAQKTIMALSKLVKSSCKYAAMKLEDDEFVHRPVYMGKLDDEAMSLLNDVKFGQTEKGSYIIPLYSYLRDTSMGLFDDSVQNDRVVLSAIHESMRAAFESAEEYLECKNKEVFFNYIDKGLHASICESLSDLLDVSGQQLEMSFKYSGKRSSDLPLDVRLPYSHSEVYSIAAEYLKSLTPETSVDIDGYVIRLAKNTLLETSEGEVWVNGMYNDMQRNFHMMLNPKFYHLAVDAHKEGKRVYAKGVMLKKGKYWWLEDVTEFKFDYKDE